MIVMIVMVKKVVLMEVAELSSFIYLGKGSIEFFFVLIVQA